MSDVDIDDEIPISNCEIKPDQQKSEDDDEIANPSIPPRSKINRRLTHNSVDVEELKLDNVDPNLLQEEEELNDDSPNFNTFVLPKAKKGGKLPNINTNISKSPQITKVTPSGDGGSPRYAKPVMTNCSIEAEREMENLLRSENASLHKQLENSNLTLEDMRRCVIEYESTIKELKDANDKAVADKMSTINGLICERDQAVQDLNTIERAFGDLQRRFEKSKEIVGKLHKNEAVLKKHADDLAKELTKSETKYNDMKVLMERKLRKANEEVEAAKRQNEGEIARLQAIAKKAELKIHGLESQLNQKMEENTELNKICEELITKYSTCDL